MRQKRLGKLATRLSNALKVELTLERWSRKKGIVYSEPLESVIAVFRSLMTIAYQCAVARSAHHPVVSVIDAARYDDYA
jgi:hypothetical protein